MPGSVPARKFSANVVHAIRARVNISNLNLATGVEIGTIPAGSFVKPATVHIITAFNAATTNNLLVGTAADDDGFVVTGGSAANATGVKANLSGALTGDMLTVDTPVVVKFTQTGTAATTGDAAILVEFYPHSS